MVISVLSVAKYTHNLIEQEQQLSFERAEQNIKYIFILFHRSKQPFLFPKVRRRIRVNEFGIWWYKRKGKIIYRKKIIIIPTTENTPSSLRPSKRRSSCSRSCFLVCTFRKATAAAVAQSFVVFVVVLNSTLVLVEKNPLFPLVSTFFSSDLFFANHHGRK